MSLLGRLLHPLFGISEDEAKGFGAESDSTAHRLETVVRTVTEGCHATFQHSSDAALVAHLASYDPEIRGFAYEGAGTGLAALDCMFPWKDRTLAFLSGAGAPYVYAVHIGAGLALARLRRNPERFLPRLDPVFGWIAIDGYGFHEGFFAPQRHIEQQHVPAQLSHYGRRTFDHGIGRAIWFRLGGRIDQIAATITSFPAERQADLWGGIGLACGYTGGIEAGAIRQLQEAACPHRTPLAVGAAIAANARTRAGSPAPYAERACAVLCGMPLAAASGVVERALEGLPIATPGAAEPAYGRWRQRIADQLAGL